LRVDDAVLKISLLCFCFGHSVAYSAARRRNANVVELISRFIPRLFVTRLSCAQTADFPRICFLPSVRLFSNVRRISKRPEGFATVRRVRVSHLTPTPSPLALSKKLVSVHIFLRVLPYLPATFAVWRMFFLNTHHPRKNS